MIVYTNPASARISCVCRILFCFVRLFFGVENDFSDKNLYKMFVGIGKSCIFASLFERRVLLKEVWRGGRVVDYSGLENRRTD